MSDDTLSDGGAEADTRSVLHRVAGLSADEIDRPVTAGFVASAQREVRP
jgi:hypothetical protein